jgi:hypothetical protein
MRVFTGYLATLLSRELRCPKSSGVQLAIGTFDVFGPLLARQSKLGETSETTP